MGLKATFDPDTKIIQLIEIPVNNSVSVNVERDLYSAAKYDWLNVAGLMNHEFPFSTFGGNDIGGGVKAGSYFFLNNIIGWRIRPYNSDHYLQLDGNLFGLDPDTEIFEPTIGGFSVVVRLNTSSLTQVVVSGSGVTEQDKLDIAEKVWDENL